MDRSSNAGSILFLLFVIVVAVIAGRSDFSAVPFTANDPAVIGTQLLTLIFIALVIERAVEVFITNQYGRAELEARRPIRLAEAHVELLDEAVRARQPVVPPVQPDARLESLRLDTLDEAKEELQKARNALVQVRHEAQPVLEELHVKKRAAAMMLAVLIGLLVAIAGVRIFADLVLSADGALTEAVANETQRRVFLTADILITALLLAGGADGIHQVLKRFVLVEKDIRG